VVGSNKVARPGSIVASNEVAREGARPSATADPCAEAEEDVRLWPACAYPPRSTSGEERGAARSVTIILLLGIVSFGFLQTRATGQRVVGVGSTPLALEIVREIEGRPACGWTLIGVVAEAAALGPSWKQYPVVGPPERLGEILEQLQPDRVIVEVDTGDLRL